MDAFAQPAARTDSEFIETAQESAPKFSGSSVSSTRRHPVILFVFAIVFVAIAITVVLIVKNSHSVSSIPSLVTVEAAKSVAPRSKVSPIPWGFRGYVINLDEREDRWNQTQKELDSVKWGSDQTIERFSATKASPGWLGCTKSHLAVLEAHMSGPHATEFCLVLEDDIQFLDSDKMSTGACREALAAAREHVDTVVLLSATHQKLFPQAKPGPGGLVVPMQSQSGAAYLVAPTYVPVLARYWRWRLDKITAKTAPEILPFLAPYHINDVTWWLLMQRDGWWSLPTSLVTQRPGYSDIEETHTDYSSQFN